MNFSLKCNAKTIKTSVREHAMPLNYFECNNTVESAATVIFKSSSSVLRPRLIRGLFKSCSPVTARTEIFSFPVLRGEEPVDHVKGACWLVVRQNVPAPTDDDLREGKKEEEWIAALLTEKLFQRAGVREWDSSR